MKVHFLYLSKESEALGCIKSYNSLPNYFNLNSQVYIVLGASHHNQVGFQLLYRGAYCTRLLISILFSYANLFITLGSITFERKNP